MALLKKKNLVISVKEKHGKRGLVNITIKVNRKDGIPLRWVYGPTGYVSSRFFLWPKDWSQPKRVETKSGKATFYNLEKNKYAILEIWAPFGVFLWNIARKGFRDFWSANLDKLR